MPIRSTIPLLLVVGLLAGPDARASTPSIVRVGEAQEAETRDSNPAPASRRSTGQQALGRSAAELLTVGSGVRLIDLDGETVLLACATSTYDPGAGDADLLALDRRRAGAEASLAARVALIAYLDGISSSSDEATLQLLLGNLTSAERTAVAVETHSERIEAVKAGLLRGALTHSNRTDEERGRVSVCVYVSPRTRAASTAVSDRLLVVDDIEEALARLERDLASGVELPDGATALVERGSGTTRYLGYASSLLRQTSGESDRLGLALGAASARSAELRAGSCLTSLLRGEAIREENLSSSHFTRLLTARESLLGGTSETREQTLAEQVGLRLASRATDGDLPPGVRWRSFDSDDGRWRHSVAWLDARLPDEPGTAQAATTGPAARPGASTEPSTEPSMGPKPAAAPEPPRECELSAREGERLVRAVGVAPSRRLALAAALREAVEKANGVSVSASSVLRQQLGDALTDMDGKLSSTIDLETTAEDEVRTSTNGLVTAFDVLSEEVGSDGATTRVEICARIPVFDPTRPRPGRRPTIAFLGFDTAAPSFEFSDTTVSADAVTEALVADLVSILVADRGFTVIDRRHLDHVEEELARLTEGLDAGTVDPSEAAKIGRRLGADYVIVGTLEQFFHRRWREYIPVRGTHEDRELLSVASRFRLLTVTTGAIITADDFVRTWAAADLTPARIGREQASLPRDAFARTQITTAHAEQLLQALRDLQRERYPRFITAVSARQIVLKYAGVDIAVGDELVLRGVRRVPLDGQVEEVEVEKGRVRIVRVDGTKEHLYAEVLEGDSTTFETGDTCRP